MVWILCLFSSGSGLHKTHKTVGFIYTGMNNKWIADDISNNSFINDALMKNKWPSSFPSVIAFYVLKVL